MHGTENMSDTTLDDENYDMCCTEGTWDMTSVLVTALCSQPEAFASDLGDNQSRYLFYLVHVTLTVVLAGVSSELQDGSVD